MAESVLYCIAYGCPKGNRSKGCPLIEIEDRSFYERIGWIDKLDDKTKKALLRHHSICTKK